MFPSFFISIGATQKHSIERLAQTAVIVVTVAVTAGCAPKAGSEAWCEDLAESPKGEWTANAAVYTKHCVLGIELED